MYTGKRASFPSGERPQCGGLGRDLQAGVLEQLFCSIVLFSLIYFCCVRATAFWSRTTCQLRWRVQIYLVESACTAKEGTCVEGEIWDKATSSENTMAKPSPLAISGQLKLTDKLIRLQRNGVRDLESCTFSIPSLKEKKAKTELLWCFFSFCKN